MAKPALHVHWNACAEIVLSDVESLHTAPLTHGLLAHSSTSTSQLPLKVMFCTLSRTLHCVAYAAMPP